MASSSSSTAPKWTYDVFLSFRGEDTRKNFVDHLYTALEDRSIYTFKDDQNLKRGKSISPELLKSIEESRFAIVVFSRNYADSSWCLDELVKIVDCKNSMGQIIVPVFYDVDPSEVRKQTGCFEENFAKHEINNKEKVGKWRKALAEAASISGWDIPNTANGHESKCIKQIVENILSSLGQSMNSSVDENLIGIESRVQNVKSLLCIGSNDVRLIGIWGMGGMGKTTVTKAVFDDISNQFEGRSYVANVREVSKSRGLPFLQEKILSEILMKIGSDICGVDEGISMMRRLCCKRVLLVIDDVDHVNQLDALVGKREWFGKGSRIIVTTRDEHLLAMHGVDEIHKVDLLNDDEALKLFSRYAFKSTLPQEFVDYSLHVVRTVGGLPLALKVLGSFLYGRNKIEWESALDRLKDIPTKEILDVLKISFDGLLSVEKELFLDIACFFIGMTKDFATPILDSFDFYPDIGISVLIQKSLLTVSNGRLEMHDLIREMGWHIVCQMYPKEPGKHSRLWFTKDVHDVLTKNTGTEAIEGIKVGWTNDTVEYSSRAFCNMKKLRLLYIDSRLDFRYSQRLEYLSNELRWIYWQGCPSDSLPESFEPEKLVHLEMPQSQIVQFWMGKKILSKLKFVELSYSYNLTRTPDFSGAPNLERLILKFCLSMEEVHPSVGDLKRLVLLDLSYCRELKTLPSPIKMIALETLILTGCSKLEVFPEIQVNMERLTGLYLEWTAIKELPPSIEKLTSLLYLDLCFCTNLVFLPNSICNLKCLKSLLVYGCTKLKELPENLGHIESVEELHLGKTAIRQPPSSIGLLKNLKTLAFQESKPIITSQPQTSFFLSWLSWKECWVSRGLVLPCLSGCWSLRKLDLSCCNMLEIPVNLSPLTSLEELNLSGNDFAYLPGSISQLSQLKTLLLDRCTKLEALQEVPSSIAVLIADDCHSLKSLACLSTKHEWLWNVSFVNWFNQSSNIADILLHSLLQGNSVINHQFSIMLPGRDIPDWFTHQEKGKFPVLQLPPNWQNKIMGFAMCFVFDSSFPLKDGGGNIHVRSKSDLVTARFNFYNMSYQMLFENEHLWMGYISLDLILQSYLDPMWSDSEHHKKDDWFAIEEGYLSLFLRWVPGKCGVRLVYKEDVKQKTTITTRTSKDSSQSRSFKFLHPRGFQRMDMHVERVSISQENEHIWTPCRVYS
ncbi:hypothetical protein LguiB_010356 [Lonicera macranthoides]